MVSLVSKPNNLVSLLWFYDSTGLSTGLESQSSDISTATAQVPHVDFLGREDRVEKSFTDRISYLYSNLM